MNINLSNCSVEDVRKQLFLIDPNFVKFDTLQLLAVTETLCDRQSESISIEIKFPAQRPGTLALIIPKTSININVSKATLTIAATVLDATIASGFANALLAILGFQSGAFARVESKRGQLCIMLLVQQKVLTFENVNAEDIHSSLAGRRCPYKSLACQYLKNETCDMSSDSTIQELTSLSRLGCLKLDGDKISPSSI
jgi:hypothetical protein